MLLVLGPLGVVAGQVVPDQVQGGPAKLAVAGEFPAGTFDALAETAAAIDLEYELQEFGSADQAEAQLADGKLDAVLVDGKTLLFRTDADSEIVFAMNAAVRAANLPAQIDALGLTLEDVAALISPEPLGVRILEPPDEDEKLPEAVAFIGIVVLYGAIVLYGQWVLLGVIEEKTSRVAEVLLGAVRPTELMVGKVAGNLMLALVQMAMGAVSGAIAVSLIASSVDVPSVALSGAVVTLVAMAMGLVFYAFAYAAAGATVSRPEDAASAAMPIVMVLLAVYLSSLLVVVKKPDSVVSVALSLVPVSAPIAMPARVALGSPAWWEVAVAFVLMSFAIVGMARLCGRIYTGAILRSGPRISLLGAFRSSAR